MPRRSSTRKSSALARRRRKMVYGGSLKSLLKRANSWLRKSKAISKGTRFLSKHGGPKWLGNVSKGARAMGYGKRKVRRRRRTGGSLGGALRLAGGKKSSYRRVPLAIAY